ncbi:MAG TPA: HAMP domain-containing sensor histidine kinase [Candidatus Baltobacteraceae bacterium]|nr:HAMP domain-containing sensor histidine kinase [Candidatus Baltobacteraceae bacterium]
MTSREDAQSALLAAINEWARKPLDRQSFLDGVAPKLQEAFKAMSCAVLMEEPPGGTTRVIARCGAPATDYAVITPLPGSEEPALRLVLYFDRSVELDAVDAVLLRAVASHLRLALTNVELYASERSRRARAESLERIVRTLRDTQTIEEVLLVFAVTVSRQVNLTTAVYEVDRTFALRRAFGPSRALSGGFQERVEIAAVMPSLELQEVTQSGEVPPGVRRAIFGAGEGIVLPLRIDGTLWGLLVFAAPSRQYDWGDQERRIYFRTIASHLQMAIAGARSFERIHELARALSESNEFKDDLLAMLAHDFKGPLTVILGYCELLLENSRTELRDEVETIYSQTQRLVRLSEDAVALAQTQAGGFSLNRVTVDVRVLVGESVKAHNQGDQRITSRMPDSPVMVTLDTARFTHVLDNLLMNALKYSAADISVVVTVASGTAVIEVTDRGIGIPEREIGGVFARFGRASNARSTGIAGSGVGLYVSRKIVQAHGGSIAVQSTEGEGTTFTVRLPLSSTPDA